MEARAAQVLATLVKNGRYVPEKNSGGHVEVPHTNLVASHKEETVSKCGTFRLHTSGAFHK